jgi:hypothetical protein
MTGWQMKSLNSPLAVGRPPTLIVCGADA